MPFKILALDTATEACSAALFYDNAIIHRYEVAPRQHTQLILPMLQSLLTEAGLTLAQLDAVAFGRGPGSFTGVRIATSIIQGIAFATDLPVIPISTLQALAQGNWRESSPELKTKPVLAAIDARMNEIYWCAYELGQDKLMSPMCPEIVCAPDELHFKMDSDFVGVGSGWDSYHAIMQQQFVTTQWIPKRYPNAYDIVTLAANGFKNGEAVSAEQALPIYLRDHVANKMPT
jgi:tRNA threonylcarbamoyladenosine biosynthesis protein TsaB